MVMVTAVQQMALLPHYQVLAEALGQRGQETIASMRSSNNPIPIAVMLGQLSVYAASQGQWYEVV